MPRRTVLFCVIALAAAAVFVRLGFWQVSRLHQKRAHNAIVARQQNSPPVPITALPHDTLRAHFRPVTVSGRYDYEHELVLSSRTRRGAPGVELLTPVRVTGSDTAVLVNRGWVYSPDGSTVDRARWREGDSAHVSGYAELFAPDAGTTAAAKDPRLIRRASRAEIAAKVPYPVAPYYLVSQDDTAGMGHPARKETIALDDGPHRSYAFQWFAFAAITVGGAVAVVRRERRTLRKV